MAKKIKIWQSAVLTKDDDSNVSLVGKAKEALTTLGKQKIEITICLKDIAKVDAEKCLKDNNVPYDKIQEAPAAPAEDYDVVVVTGPSIVQLHSDWRWCLNEIAGKLFGKHADQNTPATEQQQMDNAFEDYKKMAQECAKHCKNFV